MKVASEIEICSFQSLFTLLLRIRLWKFALPWESGSDSADLSSSLSGTDRVCVWAVGTENVDIKSAG